MYILGSYYVHNVILHFALTGFVLEGFDIEHCMESIGDVISATTQLLPEDKPRFIHGLGTSGMCRALSRVMIAYFARHNDTVYMYIVLSFCLLLKNII